MPITIHDLLAEYEATAPDTRTKGLYLERLVKRYFETEPFYQGQFEKVWLWQEWPGRGNKADTGIDLVAERKYGQGLTAIQCKFYAPTSTVQKAGIDSFISASNKAEFTERIVVSTTDKWSGHALDTLDGLQPPIRRLGLTHLAESLIDWSTYRFDSPDTAKVAERKRLRDHQILVLAGDVCEVVPNGEQPREGHHQAEEFLAERPTTTSRRTCRAP
jgi:predicted helicase